ncbi:EF-hand domain-containing protein [Desulfobulbus rhabdoformis]|jgi:hypothetical protein|uniref:EF-hand domain-containing protein n=1 Tax=Desulfobulbus rhabdoformis TaxID=34032 RepID=UPI001966AB1E|nr:EF-hand domain-containing protein [Desulfobulbus rhabdoformis]MBM9615185.1 EF-hand domain-containing protein [Desulfobulbus rhabdoformis]
MKTKHTGFSLILSSASCILFVVLGTTSCAGAAPGRALDLVFNAADTNRDNLISVQEYHQAMQRRFEQLDQNRDGNLTRQEMEKMRANARTRLQSLRGGNLSR